MAVPPAPPAPPAAPGTYAALAELDRAHAEEKRELVQKVRSLIQDHEAKSKWKSFCQVHGQGASDVNHHDMAFLVTFQESYEAGTIITQDDVKEAAGENAQPNKIFVGGLPKGTTVDQLWSFFGQWGGVDKVDCKRDDAGLPCGYAFVTFKEDGHAQQVVDNRDNNKIDGKWIDCKLADASKGGGKDKGGKDAGKGGKDGGKDGGKGGAADDAKRIFVGGLPKSATQDSVSAYFAYFGTIDRVDLKFDPDGSFRGFGFVIFASADSAAKALEKPKFEFEGKWCESKAAGASKGDKGGDKGGGKGAEKGDSKGSKDKHSKDNKDNSWSSGGDWKSSGNDWKSGNDSGSWQSSGQAGGDSSGGGDRWGSSNKQDGGNDSSWGRGGGDNKNSSWSDSGASWGASGGGGSGGERGAGGNGDSGYGAAKW